MQGRWKRGPSFASGRVIVDLLSITVVIPTYGREQVLLDTINQFVDQRPAPTEILVIDQTRLHEEETERNLRSLQEKGAIKWIRLYKPSQPGALNVALMESTQPIILFVDDDIRIVPGFVNAHSRNYCDEAVWAVAGQVLQPDHDEVSGLPRPDDDGPFSDLDFPFNSSSKTFVRNGMSGNLSVRRERAIQIGGFDENFLSPVSYRFDADFCKRLCREGGRIVFEPAARIYHLRHGRGGTRSRGSHLTSASAMHGVGDYYFALRQGLSLRSTWYILKRPFRQVRTKFHLRHPWWIPIKFVGEIRALFIAVSLFRRGPVYINREERGKEQP